jgi:colanic acid biosynthesis glycosyl transferase WcaI
MISARHFVFINEFYHPDFCASAAVLADRLPRLKRLLPNDRFTVITGNRAWDDPNKEYPAQEEHEGIRIVRVNRPAVGSRDLLSRAKGFLAFGHNAVKAAKSLGPVDLVIGTTAPPHGGGIARRMSRSLSCPYVYTVLDLYPDLVDALGRLRAGSFAYRTWMWRDSIWMRDAAKVVCIAQGITDRIIRTRGFSNTKVVTIHDGFDSARLDCGASAANSARNSFQQEFNPNQRIVIQYAGNMGLSHPFETIMLAAAKLADNDNIQFQFIGGGPQREFVRANLPRNGILIDYQPAERLGELLSSADICLISQHEEMFDKALPYKAYGILAAGKPTVFVGNEKSEIAGWLRDAEAGLSVRQGDAEGLTTALQRLIDDAQLRSRMRAAAIQLLDRQLQAEQSAAQWANLISEVVRARSASE